MDEVFVIVLFTLLGVGAGQSDALPYIGMEGRTMRSVAVGPGGVWAVAKVVAGRGGGGVP